MMNRIRRILSAVMAAAIIMTGIPFGFAEEGQMIELTPEQIAELTMPEEMAIEEPEPAEEAVAEPVGITEEPAVEEIPAETEKLTAEPTVEITAEPTIEVKLEPTIEATVEPFIETTVEPTTEPVAEPTVEVEVTPEPLPTEEPTVEPAPELTPEANVEPSFEPSAEPSTEPDIDPTTEPSEELLPQTAQELAAWFGLELREIAEAFEMTEEELLALSADEIAILYALIQEMLGRVSIEEPIITPTIEPAPTRIPEIGKELNPESTPGCSVEPNAEHTEAPTDTPVEETVIEPVDETTDNLIDDTSTEESSSFSLIKTIKNLWREVTLFIEDGFIDLFRNEDDTIKYEQDNASISGVADAVIITNRDPSTPSGNDIWVDAEGGEVSITIKDLNLNDAGIGVYDGKINIEIDGNNTIDAYGDMPAIHVIYDDHLVIDDKDNDGTLNALGGGNAAGIGGDGGDFYGHGGPHGNITINGGTIFASGAGDAAGIGSAYKGYTRSEDYVLPTITINGGNITATGGVGIGGGRSSTAGNIIINGGNVVAEGTNGAGIGGGSSTDVGNVTINGGNVTATSDRYAAIGGDKVGGTINIVGGKVTAIGGICHVYNENSGKKVPDIGADPADLQMNAITGAVDINVLNEDATIAPNRETSDAVYHIHTYDKLTSEIAATCTTQRLITFVCLSPECPDKNVADFAVGLPLGHDFIRDPNRDVEATPDMMGIEAYTCSRCNATNDKDSLYVCKHPDDKRYRNSEPDTSIAPAYKDTGDNITHYVIKSYRIFCGICFEYLETLPENINTAATANHEYINEVCICGHKLLPIRIIGKDKLVVKQSATLSAKDSNGNTINNKNLMWATGDKSIATVSAGKVTAKKTGQTTITATAKDGSTGSIVITVVPKATGVTIYRGEEALANNTTIAIDLSFEQKTCELRAVVLPETAIQDVTWKSSNAKVAQVDANGVVTALKAGTATITATTTDGSKKSAKVKISVGYNVQEITISGATELAAGKSTTLKANVSPSNATNKGVTWASSDTNLAKVDSKGKVTAAKKVDSRQSVIITATAKDGGGVTAQHEIWITPKATKIVLKDSKGNVLGKTVEINLNEKNPTIQLIAEVLPDGASQAVKWKNSSKKVATVSADGIVTALKKGSVTITATAQDGSGKSANIKISCVEKEITEPSMTFSMSPSDIVAPNKDVCFTFDLENCTRVELIADGQAWGIFADIADEPYTGTFEWSYAFNTAGENRKVQFIPYNGDEQGEITAAQYIDVGYYLRLADGITMPLTADSTGGEGSPIKIESNVEWIASSNVDWIHPTADVGNGKLLATYDANNGEERKGSIFLAADGCDTIEIQVVQLACQHPEFDDAYIATISITDNEDGATHTHIYKANRICKICNASLGNIEINETSEKHRIEEGEAYYKTDENGHQLITPMVCSCGYEGASIVDTFTQHNFNTLANTILSINIIDGSYHRFDEENTYECVCKKNKVVFVEGDPKLHVYVAGKCIECGLINMDFRNCMNELINLDTGKNAMANSTIAETVRNRIMESGLSTDKVNDIVSVLYGTPETFQRLYIFSIFEYGYDLQDIDAYYKDTGLYDDWGGKWFKVDSEDQNKIHLPPTSTIETWFHESGHAIDFNCQWNTDSYFTNTWEFYHILCDDLKQILKEYLEKAGGSKLNKEEQNYIVNYIVSASGEETTIDNCYNKALGIGADLGISIPDELSKEGKVVYRTVVEKLSLDLMNEEFNDWDGEIYGTGYDDVISGLTNNTIIAFSTHRRSDKRVSLGIEGDCENYWYENGEQTGMASMEAWANYFSANLLNDTDLLKMFRKYFPNGCNKMDKIAEDMLNIYKERMADTLN